MAARTGLGDFLRTRRARLPPDDLGLVVAHPGRRRTPGLRREDVAQLAGISVDYYTRLEQGRTGAPSAQVLQAVSRALRLDGDERTHLFGLAQVGQPATDEPAARAVRDPVRRTLDALTTAPAVVLDRRLDVLAANPLWDLLVSDPDRPMTGRNMMRFLLLDDTGRDRYLEWEAICRENVAHLRAQVGRHPDDPDLAGLVEELWAGSELFRDWWARHDVRLRTHGRKRIRHPAVGTVELDFEALQLPDDGQVLVVHTAEPGSRSEQALRLLSTMVPSDR